MVRHKGVYETDLRILGMGLLLEARPQGVSISLAFSRTISYPLLRIKSIQTTGSETMKRNHPILSLLVITLAVPFLVSCTTAPPPDTTAEDLQAIKAVSEQFVEAFNRGDAAAVAAIFIEEANLLPPNSPIIVGRESIQALYQGWFDAGVGDLQATVTDLHVNGDMAHDVGKYTLTIQPEEGEAIIDDGKYVEIWKRENGSWKMDVDIWNSSLPLPAPEEEETAEEE